MSTPPPAVRINGLTKTFGTRGAKVVQAVRGVDLTISSGEIVALLGPNGAGKTTTLDVVLGLSDPSDGRVDVLGMTPRRAVDSGRVSAVLQTGGLLADISVRETVELIASTYREHIGVNEAMRRAGIEHLAARRVSKCSGGEQQRLRFALALLPDPDLLILDEPTAGMDVSARHEFWDTMRADAGSGRTVIFATHYLEEADAFADRIVMMARGAVVADGSTEQIRSRAGGRVVSADFSVEGFENAMRVIASFPGVESTEARGCRIYARTQRSDDLARQILTELDGSALEIATANLDHAFMTLTESAHEGDNE
ncbi:ABC transporter ATP-binding protein [Blastococcus sp. Marseille-P5729]|uniref:ABC transporter ATP-binding protein n=1 Tax=Blastococcus sp. Marseille-P5729 TaxID=2086582 RepID=UPI000D108D0B|nr:ABC transporter ATP-binding protein [Blastococcus sp. Marseille-P5729]